MAGPLSWRQEKRIQALIGGGGGGGGPYITNAVINGSGNLILTFSDSSTIDAGHVVGATGDDAPNVMIQYSVSGVSWHTPFAEGDLYIRFSTDGGSSWSSAARMAGPQGDAGNPGDPSIYKPFAVAMAIALG